MKRITCREIGERLGVSHSTVSLALRDHPRIPLETRQRIRDLAAQLGYRPDPALASLNAYRQARKTAKYQANLAWVNFISNVWIDYFEGAKSRAGELGFKLQEFELPEPSHWSRLGKVLKSCGIEGILIPPSPPSWQSAVPMVFSWEDFHIVSVARATSPRFHLCINNQFQSAGCIVRRLVELGYQKIGMILPEIFADSTEFHFLGGYLSECARLRLKPHIFFEAKAREKHFHRDTVRWLFQHRPEAVIASGPGDILPALKLANLRVPQDIAVAFLSHMETHPEFAGIDQNNRKIGEMAANLLIDLIRRNERGIPALPIRQLVEGVWIPGSSAPPKSDPGSLE